MTETAGERARLDALDVLRGLVMVVMALDHTRDYFHAADFDPLDLRRTSAALFLTRWVTHFCAPVFVFLAGVGAHLAGRRGRTRGELSRFLLVRGLWLVLLELSVVRLGWSFSLDPHFAIAQVLWAIGWSMVVLAGLVHLPRALVLGLGLLLIAGHDAFDGVATHASPTLDVLWRVLHVRGPVEFAPGWHLFVLYPLLPWIGVMAAGYGLGGLLAGEQPDWRRRTRALGLGTCALFVLLRLLNRYGDPVPWQAESRVLFSVFSFLDCEKYPPSLDYVLMTLGPALLLLSLLPERARGPAARLAVYGRVPLFYYLLHIPLIHVLALAAGTGFPSGSGFGLPAVYAVWLLVVLLLYLPCRSWGELKRTRRSAWLSYL